MNLIKGPRGEPLITVAEAARVIAAEPQALAIAEAENGRFLVRVLSIGEFQAEFHIIAQLIEPWQGIPIGRKKGYAEN